MVPAAEDPGEARQRIEAMSVEERMELQRRQQQFERKDPAEQQRLRNLHDAVERQPDADALRGTMRRYSEWLKTLPIYRRAELVEMAPDERIEEIKRVLAEQKRELVRQRDAEGGFRWVQAYAEKHADRIKQGLSESARRRIEELDPAVRRRWLVWTAWRQLQPSRSGRHARPARLPPLSEDDLKDILAAISPETAATLQPMSIDEKRRKIAGIMRDAFRHASAARHTRSPLSEEHEKKLDQFFEEMDSRERDRLLSLPGDEMMRELRRLYLTQFDPPQSSGSRPGGSRRGTPSQRRRAATGGRDMMESRPPIAP